MMTKNEITKEKVEKIKACKMTVYEFLENINCAMNGWYMSYMPLITDENGKIIDRKATDIINKMINSFTDYQINILGREYTQEEQVTEAEMLFNFMYCAMTGPSYMSYLSSYGISSATMLFIPETFNDLIEQSKNIYWETADDYESYMDSDDYEYDCYPDFFSLMEYAIRILNNPKTDTYGYSDLEYIPDEDDSEIFDQYNAVIAELDEANQKNAAWKQKLENNIPLEKCFVAFKEQFFNLKVSDRKAFLKDDVITMINAFLIEYGFMPYAEGPNFDLLRNGISDLSDRITNDSIRRGYINYKV